MKWPDGWDQTRFWAYWDAACWAVRKTGWVFGLAGLVLAPLTFLGQGVDAMQAMLEGSDLKFLAGAVALEFFAIFGFAVLHNNLAAEFRQWKIANSDADLEKSQRIWQVRTAREFATILVPYLFVWLVVIVWPQVTARQTLTELGPAVAQLFAFFVGAIGVLLPMFAYEGVKPQASKRAGQPALPYLVGIGVSFFVPVSLALLLPPSLYHNWHWPSSLACAGTCLCSLAGIGWVLWRAYRNGAVVMPERNYAVGVAATLSGLVLLALWNRQVTAALGSPAVVLAAGALVLLVVGMAEWALRHCHWAVAAGVRVVGLVWLGLAINKGGMQTRPVRLLEPATTQEQQTMEQLARAWLESKQSKIAAAQKAGKRYPVLLVTAEGGGLRAAYWSASVLSRLQDDFDGFDDHVFGISGVSGGSVGAMVYAELVAAEKKGPLLPKARQILQADFLGPVLANLFTRDALRTATLDQMQFTDRAVALEEAFEQSWQEVMGTNRLAEPFGNQRLFLNSTEDGVGRKQVVNPALWPLPIRKSTAMILSARFPVVSPGGGLKEGRYVDGGYFDNSGTTTGRELWQALQAAAKGMQLAEQVEVYVLTIGNDVPSTKKLCEVDEKEPLPPEPPSVALPLFGAVATLEAVRVGHSSYSHQELRRTAGPGRVLDDLSLYPCRKEHSVPLGWSLAGTSRRLMDQRLESLWKSQDNLSLQTMKKLLPARKPVK